LGMSAFESVLATERRDRAVLEKLAHDAGGR
jgi:hypothetical protein